MTPHGLYHITMHLKTFTTFCLCFQSLIFLGIHVWTPPVIILWTYEYLFICSLYHSLYGNATLNNIFNIIRQCNSLPNNLLFFHNSISPLVKKWLCRNRCVGCDTFLPFNIRRGNSNVSTSIVAVSFLLYTFDLYRFKTALFYICYSFDIPIIINAKIYLPSIVIWKDTYCF